MIQCLLLSTDIDWGSVSSWLTLVTAIITIVSTYIYFNKQPKEEIHPIITISNNNTNDQKNDSRVEILFFATNKSNVPVSLAFRGVRLAKNKNSNFDRLGNEFKYEYLNINQTTKAYKCNWKHFKELFPEGDKIVFCFANEIDESKTSEPIDIKALVEKVY